MARRIGARNTGLSPGCIGPRQAPVSTILAHNISADPPYPCSRDSPGAGVLSLNHCNQPYSNTKSTNHASLFSFMDQSDTESA
eukprot:2553981-Pyramimonas_sp.AAC.1